MKVPQLEDLGDITGKNVLLRADFNVPLSNGHITDDLRIRAALPTIEWLVEQGANVTACSHLGRPKGKPDPQYSMEPVRGHLATLAPSVGLLENLRFNPGEEKNDPGVRAGIDRRIRSLRQRRVRRVAPGARVDRRATAVLAVGRGPAVGQRGRGAHRPANTAEATVRGHPRRREDQRQARRHRSAARHRRFVDHRRRHVLHVPQGQGLFDRLVVVRGRHGRDVCALARFGQVDPSAERHRGVGSGRQDR